VSDFLRAILKNHASPELAKANPPPHIEVEKFDEAKVVRGKTTEGTNAGSFAPKTQEDGRGVLVTSNVEEAVKALGEGRRVELSHVREVSTLIDRLGVLAREAIERGDKNPKVYDLCKVTVKGTNLFCVESKGIERAKMPQLSGDPVPGSLAETFPRNHSGGVDASEPFIAHLRGKGYEVTDEQEAASYLRASQRELNGLKVAKMAAAINAGKMSESAIFISSDNYVIDGHHRWAAFVAVDTADAKLGDKMMNVRRVNAPVLELLQLAGDFTRIAGIKGAGVAHFGKRERCVGCERRRDKIKSFLQSAAKLFKRDWDESQVARGKTGEGTNAGSFAPKEGSRVSPEERKARAEKLGFDTTRVWYHGTFSDFEAFQREHANTEAYWGDGIYFSSSAEDVSRNYTNQDSPDWSAKISMKAEELQQEYENRHLYGDEADKEAARLSDVGQWLELAGQNWEDLSWGQKREITGTLAKQGMFDHGGLMLQTYLRMENPIDLTEDNKEIWTAEYATDENDDIVEVTGKLNEFADALLEEGRSIGVTDRSLSELEDMVFRVRETESLAVAKLMNAMPKPELYNEEGNYVDYKTLMRGAFIRMGYDGIIMDASKAFPQIVPGDDVRHAILFDAAKVRSIYAEFDPNEKDSDNLTKAEWNEDAHPRGKTTEGSNSGSFAPTGGAGGERKYSDAIAALMGQYEEKFGAGFDVDPAKEPMVAVYHGTASDALPMILEEGLRPGAKTNVRRWGDSYYTEDWRANSIFMVSSPTQAINWARRASTMGNIKNLDMSGDDMDMVVLKLEVPRSVFTRMSKDDLVGDSEHLMMQGEIPSKYIKGYVQASPEDGFWDRTRTKSNPDLEATKYFIHNDRFGVRKEETVTLYVPMLFLQSASKMKKADSWLARLLLKFDPDQPRDERGRWAETPQQGDMLTGEFKDARRTGAPVIEFSGDVDEDLDLLSTADWDLGKEILEHYAQTGDLTKVDPPKGADLPAMYVRFEGDASSYGSRDGYVYVADEKGWVDRTEFSNFVRQNAESAYPDIEEKFNREFWDAPGPLYHATPEENVEAILSGGIEARHESRGMSNRHISHAVFTADSWEGGERNSYTYGAAIFEIDMEAMKRDGKTPFVYREPDVVERDREQALAHHLGDRSWSTDSDSNGEMEDTVIIDSPIHRKYLKLVTEELAKVAKREDGWLAKREWDESKHPRDDRGRWTDGGTQMSGAMREAVSDTLMGRLRSSGGFTYQPFTLDSPKEGYALSIVRDKERVLTGTVTEKDVADYLAEHDQVLRDNPNAYLGGWVDTETGKVYLDISIVERNLDKAVKLAKEHGQEGIYDLGKFETIIVKAPEERRKSDGARAVPEGGNGEGDRRTPEQVARGFLQEVLKFDANQPRNATGQWVAWRSGEVRDIPAGPNKRKVSVIANPSEAELARFGGREIANYRVVTVPREGGGEDRFIWAAEEAMHKWVRDWLGAAGLPNYKKGGDLYGYNTNHPERAHLGKFDANQPRDDHGRWVRDGAQTITVESWEYKRPGIRYQNKLSIIVNPSAGDMRRWAADEVDTVRYLPISSGKYVFWNASEALHAQVAAALKITDTKQGHEVSVRALLGGSPLLRKSDVTTTANWLVRLLKYLPAQERWPEGTPVDPVTGAGGGRWAPSETEAGYTFPKDADGKPIKGEVWRDANGNPAPDNVVARLKEAKVPAGYSRVVLNADPEAPCRAIGYDAKGREKRFFSQEWHDSQASIKFADLKRFNEKLPGMRERVERDLVNTTGKDRIAAQVVYTLDKTGYRIGGGEDELADKDAFGITTILSKHVRVDGDKVSFNFPGKKGEQLTKTVEDARLAAIFTEAKQRARRGEPLLDVSSSKVNRYIKDISGDNFSAKDYRAWNGTALAIREMQRWKTLPRTEKEMQERQIKVLDKVAAHLGNTRAVAKSAYVDPAVWTWWKVK
jgi:DNA topoisomerase I